MQNDPRRDIADGTSADDRPAGSDDDPRASAQGDGDQLVREARSGADRVAEKVKHLLRTSR